MLSEWITVRTGDYIKELQIGQCVGDFRERYLMVVKVVKDGRIRVRPKAQLLEIGRFRTLGEIEDVDGTGYTRGKKNVTLNSIRIPVFRIDKNSETAVLRQKIKREQTPYTVEKL